MTDDKLMAGTRWLSDMASDGGSQVKPTPELLIAMAQAIERDIAVRWQVDQGQSGPPMVMVNGHWGPMMSPELSDGEVATRVRMLMRSDLNHEYACTLARDRIMSLSQRLAAKIATQAPELKGLYLIWSNEHRAWWRPNRCGYTVHVDGAGRYSQAEAVAICRDARGGWKEGEPPPEIPVREADALASAVPV